MQSVRSLGSTISNIPIIGPILDLGDKIAANTDPTQLTFAAFGVSEKDRIDYAHAAGLVAAAVAGGISAAGGSGAGGGGGTAVGSVSTGEAGAAVTAEQAAGAMYASEAGGVGAVEGGAAATGATTTAPAASSGSSAAKYVRYGAAAVSALGQIEGGYQSEANLEVQAAMADREAGLADRNAELARLEAAAKETEAIQIQRKSEIEQQIQKKKTRLILGEMMARMAQNGVDISTGSTLDLIGSTAEDQGLIQDVMAYDARVNVWKARREGAIYLDRAKVYNYQADAERYQADVYRRNAKQAVLGGWLSGAGSAMSTYALTSKYAG